VKTKPRKGLQDIRIRSSLAGEAVNPQRKFLRVAHLELQKALCEKVRDCARKRAEEMERKIAEIEVEKAKLLVPGQVSEPGQPHPTPASHLTRDLGSRERRGLALKY